MSDQFDVVIIGAGHNGLTAAAILAKRGKKVCVLERAEKTGGMSGNKELAPGVLAPRIAHLAYNLNSTVMKELGLEQKLRMKSLNTVSLSPDGNHVEISSGAVRYVDGRQHPDEAAFLAIREDMRKFSQILAPLALQTPPDMSGGLGLSNFSEIAPLAKLGLKMKMMGKKDMRNFMRVLLSNIYDQLLSEMQDGPLTGVLAADAIIGNWAGPRSPGSVLSLMYKYGAGGDMVLPIGGMGAISSAIEDVAVSYGAIIRTGTAVKNVIIEDDAVSGVVLDDGSSMTCKAVLSSAGAFPSMMLAGPEHYDVEAVRRLRNVRAKGTTAKVNLVLSELPSLTGLSEKQQGQRLLISPSADYAEQSFNAVKYGEIASAPVIELVFPTLSDPSLSDGPHILSAIVQGVPYHLKGGWDAKAKEKLSKTVFDNLSIYAPGIEGLVTHREILSPADIEAETGAPGGHWHHAELSTDQMLSVRPVNLMSRYEFGIRGYYLCGAGAHPGGDVSGAAGRNSALQLLKAGVLA